jgi:hypothetical protein
MQTTLTHASIELRRALMHVKPQARATKLRVRTEQITKYMGAYKIDTNAELAKRMGTVTESTVSRMRNGKDVSPETQAGLFNAFPDLDFADFFELVRDEEDESVAAVA